MAKRDVYDLSIRIGVEGDARVQGKLKGVDRYLARTQKRAKKLERLKLNMDAKIKDKASPTLEKIKRKATETYRSVKDLNWSSVGDKIGGAFKKGARLALTYGAIIGSVLGGISMADMISTHKDFTTSLSKVQAVSGADPSEMAALEREARRLGETTEWTAAQAADAEVALSQMGFTPQQTIASLEDMLSLATAGELELGRAAEIVGGTLNAFGYSADEASRVADTLAVAASSSGTNVELMGESFRYAAPLAAGMGMEIEETAAALAILGNMNIKGSQAGTTMVAMLNDLTSTSKKAQSAMASIGFSAYDAQGRMKDFPTMMAELSESLQGMTDEAKTSVLKDIFGTRATRGVLTFLKQGPEKINAMVDAMHNAEGAAKSMADVMKDNLTGDIKILRSAVQEEQLKMAEKLDGPLRGVIQAFTAQVPRIGEALAPAVERAAEFIANIDVEAAVDNGIKALKTLWELLKGAAKAAKTIVGPIIKVGSFLIKTFNDLPEPVQRLIGGLGAVLFIAKPIAGLFGGWGSLISNAGSKVFGLLSGFKSTASIVGLGPALLNPWVLGTTGIAAATVLIWKNWDKVSEFITNASQKALEFFHLTDEERKKNPSQYYYDADWDYVKGEEKAKPVAPPDTLEAPAVVTMKQKEEIIPEIATDFGELPVEIQQVIDDAYVNYDTGLGDMVDATEVRTGEMVNTVTATRDDFVVAGTDVILGLVEGINGAAEQAVQAVANVAQQMAATARANLKIASPSKLFEHYGEMLPEGLVLGINNLKDKAIQSMDNLTQIAMPRMGDNQGPTLMPAMAGPAPVQIGNDGGGNNMQFDVNVVVAKNDDDIRAIADEATAEFGRQIYEALMNRQR